MRGVVKQINTQDVTESGRHGWVVGLRDTMRHGDLYEKSLSIFQELGNKHGLAMALNNLGNAILAQGNFAEARKLYEEALMLRKELGDKQGIGALLVNLGEIAYLQGDYKAAIPLY